MEDKDTLPFIAKTIPITGREIVIPEGWRLYSFQRFENGSIRLVFEVDKES